LNFLDDGTYDDGDVDEDYDQKITLSSKTLSLFADTDYNDKEATVGFKWANGDNILTYEIEFDDVVNYTEMVDTDLPLLGKEYYVLAASSTQIDVLDSAEKTVLTEGETATVGGKTVSIAFIDEDEVKFNVGSETTDKLVDHGYEELSDGTYIVANEVLYDSKESGISKVEFSIGSGKIELIEGEDIEVNDEDVDGLQTTITDSTGLSKIEIVWNSDRDSFLTEDSSLSMPLFEAISLAYDGLEYDSDEEVISFENGDTFEINMDNLDIPVLYFDGSTATLGEEDYELIVATSDVTTLTGWDANHSDGLDLEETDRFIITRIDDDLSDVEMLYYEVKTVDNDTGTIDVELEDLIGSNDITFDSLDTDEIGDITVELAGINGSTSGRAYLNFTATGTITYNKVVSDKGLVIDIPAAAATSAVNGTGAVLTLTEADKDEDVNTGAAMTVTVKNNSNDNLHVSTHNLTSYDEEESDDVFMGVVPSDLASTFTFDTNADENDFSIVYTGKEAIADVSVIAAGVVSSEDTALGNVVIKDTEVSSMSGKNLVVVGGSCINSVAANILGGSLCGPAFTSSTGIGSGQFLIKSVASPYNAEKVALLVAGYESEDTVAASTYLRTQAVNTDVGMAYKGTSSTSAELIVE